MKRSDTESAPSRRKIFFFAFVFLFLGILPCLSASCRKKAEEPDGIVGAAYVEEILSEAESYGNTKKALAFLTGEWERTPSQRLSIAVNNLIRSQWKETRRVATYLKDGEEVTFLRYESAYDENGNQLFYAWYEDDGSVEEKTEYAYDAQGNNIAWTRYNKGGGVDVQVENTFDADGNLISETAYHADEDYYTSVTYEYDDTGNTVSRKSFSDGVLTSSEEYGYDGYGNQIRSLQTDGTGQTIHRSENTFDADGKPLTEIGYAADGSVNSEKEYAYDDGGRLTAEKWMRSSRTNEYEYDSEGRMTHSVHTDSEKRQESFFDEAGNNVSTVVYGPDGKVVYRYEHTFDAAGNPLSYVRFDGSGKIMTGNDRIYDERGQLLTATSFGEDGELTGRTDRRYDENGNLTELLSYSFDPKYAKFSYLRNRVEYVYDGDGALISEIHYAPAGNAAERIDYEYAFFPLP